MASEKVLERNLRIAVEDAGGQCYKLWPVSASGWPDRLVLLPGARICFVETKSTGDRQGKQQRYIRGLLEKMGFKVYVIDTDDKLNDFKREYALGN